MKETKLMRGFVICGMFYSEQISEFVQAVLVVMGYTRIIGPIGPF